MAAEISNNKRIAKNTMYMYIRFFVTLIVGLYTSRLVLSILGVSDYGLYSVVGGILALFTFISSSLGQATARFLNYEMGKPDGDVNRIFCINVTAHVVMGLFIFIIGEAGGMLYLYNYLNVEPEKIPDAVFCFQTAILVSCLGIINTPYNSLFMAKEHFGFLSVVDIVNTLVRLGLIIMLQYASGNLLRLYALIMVVTTVNTFIIFHVVAYKKWPEIVKYRIIGGWDSYKEVLTFGWWNLLSTMAQTARSSGSDMLINAFCGTSINGAYAISRTVSQHAITVTSFFDSASIPQITKAYSAGDVQRYTYLVNKIGRITLLLFTLLFFPLWIELDYLLHIWLIEVPAGVLLLTKLNLVLSYVSVTSGGIVTFINATGKIKWFKIVLSTFFLLCLPAGYVLLKLGFPYYVILVLFIIADIFHRITQFILVKKILQYDIVSYMKEAYVRPGIIILLMSAFLKIYDHYLSVYVISPQLKVLTIFICLLMTAFLCFFIGLKKGERRSIVVKIKAKTTIGFINKSIV